MISKKLIGIIFTVFGGAVFSLYAQEANVNLNQVRGILNAFEDGSHYGKGAWNMSNMKVLPIHSEEAKAGKKIFRFSGAANSGAGKGDCSIYNGKIEANSRISLWVKLSPDSNVEKIGFQTTDNEDEGLLVLFNADWTGWKKIETDFATDIKQAWQQGNKNAKTDFPIKGIRLAWFTKGQGESYVDVDALEILSNPSSTSEKLQKNFVFPNWAEENKENSIGLIFNNEKDEPLIANIEIAIQEDSILFNKKSPDPILGSDHALGAKGWLIFDEKKIEDNSLTDGDDYSANSTEWMNDHFTEAFQIVDLGRVLNVKGVKFKSGDANWCWRMTLLASEDGENFTPVPGSENFNMHKQWGTFDIPLKGDFRARFIKLHYTTEPGEKKSIIRMPSAMMIYDGIEDEKIDFPKIGKKVFSNKKTIKIPSSDYLVEQLNIPPLARGAYLISLITDLEGKTEIINSNYISLKVAEKSLQQNSRFGLNGSDISAIPYYQQLGLGWVRFENMKWAFISPEKDRYFFDGSVGPWYVKQDEIIKAYTGAGISYLPYVFFTPKWATTAPDGHKNWKGFPPKDFNDYGTCVFQIVARYGSVKHPENILLTNDKLSGMGLLKVIELWNEPNLNDESWGPWVGTIESYFDIFRIGAEAAKKADPSIKVSSCGWAGISLETVSNMKSYKYSDGKSPLDFADILNVHFYSGRADPETAFVDPNVQRGKQKLGQEDNDYETELRYLNEWWSEVKPGAPIWLTETGYDVGGPIGRDERYQAAKLPRCLMMALASGIEKVFVYREIGSTPAQHAGAGLIRDDRSYRPSFFTYATLIRELDGVKSGRVPRLVISDNPSIWLYLWERENEKILTAWTIDEEATLPLNLGECSITDSFARTIRRNVNSDLKLSIFPIYIKDIGNMKEIEKIKKEAEERENDYKNRKKEFLAKKRYLFDFGSREFVGKISKFGVALEYQPVVSVDIFNEEKGWGFDKPAHGDYVTKWITSKIDKDSCKVKDNEFIVETRTGCYNIEIHAIPIGKKTSLIIKTASGEMKIETSKDSPVGSAKVNSNGKISFVFGDWYNLAWIRIVEEK